jgi:hypothetical protein
MALLLVLPLFSTISTSIPDLFYALLDGFGA